MAEELNKSILVIDDADAIRTFLRISLGDLGMKVTEAKTARDGLQAFRDQSPDYVALDLGLPDDDGIEVLRQIKADGAGKRTHVIVLSARYGNKIKDEARALGALAFIPKPFVIDDLLEVIGC
ncbi:response regulator [Kordiimonas lacus]|uniref:Response regulator receiver domain-containing protein n=1 Tax=Kordiimonas lacus TaxID=637679 RepID=A0A1G6Y8F2_9PROT|nr:response regulator [Kordiimonas lacus]SDD86764.1 Response regulator receiver domain-containing protein [Kordiimonas lacus]